MPNTIDLLATNNLTIDAALDRATDILNGEGILFTASATIAGAEGEMPLARIVLAQVDDRPRAVRALARAQMVVVSRL